MQLEVPLIGILRGVEGSFFKEVFMNEKLQFWQDLKSGRFASMVKESAKGQRLSNSREAYNVLKPVLAENDDVEKVYVIYLDAQNKILAIEKLFVHLICIILSVRQAYTTDNIQQI